MRAMILAAGLGTRMKSDRAKVLHEVARRPMIAWAVETARAAGAEHIVAILHAEVQHDVAGGCMRRRVGEQLGRAAEEHPVVRARPIAIDHRKCPLTNRPKEGRSRRSPLVCRAALRSAKGDSGCGGDGTFTCAGPRRFRRR